MGSFHHCQPSNAGLHRDERSTISNLCICTDRRNGKYPAVLGPSKNPNEILQDEDRIEILNMTGPSLKEPLNHLDVPATVSTAFKET